MALNFQQRNPALTSRVLLILLLVASAALVFLYAREGEDGALHAVQSNVSGIFAPVGMAGAAANAGVDSLSTTFENITADSNTLSGLKDYNAQLLNEHAQLQEYKQENERLQQLLDLKDKYDLSGTAARVIGRSSQAWNQTVTLDKGSADGVATGQTVMGTSGVVGQVISATNGTATVRLLSDPQSGAAAMVQSSRDEGIVTGSLSGVLYLEDLETDAKVEAGDVIITSGLGGSYAKGLIIGTVVSVETAQGDSSRRAVISPNDEISSLEEVFVVSTVDAESSSSSSASSAGADGSASSSAGDTSRSSDANSTSSSSNSSNISSLTSQGGSDVTAQSNSTDTTASGSTSGEGSTSNSYDSNSTEFTDVNDTSFTSDSSTAYAGGDY